MEVTPTTNSTKDLYQGIRKNMKKFKPSNDTVKEGDGTILCDGEDIKTTSLQHDKAGTFS